MKTKVKKWLGFAVLLVIMVLLPLLIGKQPLSDAQLRQIIANWFGYPVDQIQFEDTGLSGIASMFGFFSATDPTIEFVDNRFKNYEVVLPNGMNYSICIDRFTGIIYQATSTAIVRLIDVKLTEDKMLPPNQAIALARQYLHRYCIWADTSDWEVKETMSEIMNGRWVNVQPIISINFEPPLQIPQLPEGVEFVNRANFCSIMINAINGDFVGYHANYSQIDFLIEPLITPEEAEAIGRQYLASKGMQVEETGEWISLGLGADLEANHARLAYGFEFIYRVSENESRIALVGVDAHTGEVVFLGFEL